MVAYSVTFIVNARDRNDAEHWAHWVANYETIMRDVTLQAVHREYLKGIDEDKPAAGRLGES